MAADVGADERTGRSAERFRTPESYTHWDRGLAITAGMIGIVLLFLLLITTLPIRSRGESTQLTGTAGAPAAPASTAPPSGGRPATAQAPAVGPDQPRVTATTRQFPFVRAGPGINYAVLMNLTQGQRVEVVGRSVDRQWYQIVRPDNASARAWVSQEFLQVDGDVNTLPDVRE